MNLLAKGQALLLRLLARDASPAGSVVYVRKVGGAEIDLTGSCWVGRTPTYRYPEDAKPSLIATLRDYLVPVSLLSGPPVRGDCFEQDVGESTPKVYEVVSLFDEPEWVYSDPGQTLYRVHTKRAE